MTTTSPAPRVDRAATADVLRLAVGHSSRRLRQQAGDELTPSQAAVFARIAREKTVTPSRLAELERISRPTITRLVARLRERGLVECRPDPQDGRSYTIEISADGSALRELRRRRKYAYLTRLLERADPEELELIERSSRVLLRLLDEDA